MSVPMDFPERLELARFFEGPSRAWGIVVDRRGRVRRRFRADVVGRRGNGNLVLDEEFVFDDGERDTRVWTIREDGGALRGEADDILDHAQGSLEGPVLRWRYDMMLPVGKRRVRVSFDDWLVLADRDVMLSRADIRKFGIRLGEVVIAFRKGEVAQAA